MTSSDRPAFAAQLTMLAEVYDHPVSEPLAEIYFGVLERYAVEDIAWAARQHVEASKFFPRPSELVELVQRRRRALVERQETERRDRLALPQTPEDIETGKRTAAYWIGKFQELVQSVTAKRSVRL